MRTMRKKTPRVLALLAFSGALVLAGSQGAAALGWSSVVNCTGGGQLSGRTYQITWSNAGGNSYADLGCGGNTGIQIYYQAYHGGPYYWSSQKVAQGYQVSMTQSGTWNGRHTAFNNSGVQVGSVNS